ncbi:hypothetical protein [Brevundimonas diminuta]|uniref:hypothetical protein n=1 Tax=Brevundimonas diminuta TaxID=293 RepID=UPI003F7F941B
MSALVLDSRELTYDEIDAVSGGIIDSIKIWLNSNTAKATCGKGNVESVTTEGFTCKAK